MATSALGFVGAVPVDKRQSQGLYVLAGSGETVLERSNGGAIAGVEVIGPSAVAGPVIVRNRGANGAGTVQVVNFTVSGGNGTAWVPFTATAAAGAAAAKAGDVLTIAGVPAGSAVKLLYR